MNTPTQKTHLVIATPMYGGKSEIDYCSSMNALMERAAGYNLRITPLYLRNESLVQRARNNLTYQFLNHYPDAQWLMFIDADIGFATDYIPQMIACAEQHKVSILAGIYPKKELSIAKLVAAANAGLSNPEHYAGEFVVQHLPVNGSSQLNALGTYEPFEVARIGTGFMLIHRRVFEEIATQRVMEQYTGISPFTQRQIQVLQFFHCHIAGRNYLSEDYYFCDLARSAGFGIYTAPWVSLHHVGNFSFKGCYWCSQGVHIHNTEISAAVKSPSPEVTPLSPEPKTERTS